METQPPASPTVWQQVLDRLTAMQSELTAISGLVVEASGNSELTPSQDNPYIMHDKHNIVVTLHDASSPMQPTQLIPLREPSPNLLKSGKKPQKKYKHHCQVCDGEWIGDEPSPPNCNYCRSLIWKTGETKWELRRRAQHAGTAPA